MGEGWSWEGELIGEKWFKVDERRVEFEVEEGRGGQRTRLVGAKGIPENATRRTRDL